LAAKHHQPRFNEVAKQFDVELISGDRGAPENIGLDFKGQETCWGEITHGTIH